MCCRKFNKTIEILQGDIAALEDDKNSLAQKFEQQSKRSVLSDIVVGRRTLGGKGSPYSSPFSSPYVSRKESAGVGVKSGGGDSVESVTLDNTLQTPLLLSRVGLFICNRQCVQECVFLFDIEYISSCMCSS